MSDSDRFTSDFLRALTVVLRNEGGYVDHPDDPGGATFRGVTQGTYDAFRSEAGESTQDVSQIEDNEMREIYLSCYWVPAHCGEWPWPLDLHVFDAAVNHGPKQAIRLLQKAVGASVDGIVGPQTRRKVEEADVDEAVRRFQWKRLEFYGEIVKGRPASAAFLVGWIRRVRHLEEAAA